MSLFSRSLFVGSLYFTLSCLSDVPQLSAYVVVPRSTADVTDRMNAGGDPPDRVGLLDDQRSPEYLDDWWGENDYYYSMYGRPETGKIRDPVYNSNTPPYYPYPNTDFSPYQNTDYNNTAGYNSSVGYYNYNTRYYRPGYPR